MKEQIFITPGNVGEMTERICQWIAEYVNKHNRKGVVVGMSGGIDCCVTAMLCKRAGIDTHLIMMPFKNNMFVDGSFERVSELINKHEEFKLKEFDIEDAFDAMKLDFNDSDAETKRLAESNLKARLRMTYLYQYAQLKHLFVVGTSNLSERMTGYCTKWGDSVSDFNPVGNLTKTEIYIVAKHIGVPQSIIDVKPSAGFWMGQTDEDEMGFTYKELDEWIITGTTQSAELDDKIYNRYNISQHKRIPIPMFDKDVEINDELDELPF
jgi:NAD+ synthase